MNREEIQAMAYSKPRTLLESKDWLCSEERISDIYEDHFSVGTEGHEDIAKIHRKFYIDTYPSYFESTEFTPEQIEYLLKRISEHRKDKSITITHTKQNSGMSYNGLCREHIWIDEQLAMEEEPVIIPKQTPFWANDWRKKHKRK